MSVLDDNAAGEFSAGAAGDGAIVIDRDGNYLCASFGISDTSLGDELYNARLQGQRDRHEGRRSIESGSSLTPYPRLGTVHLKHAVER